MLPVADSVIRYFFYYTPSRVIIKYWLYSLLYMMTLSEKPTVDETQVCGHCNELLR